MGFLDDVWDAVTDTVSTGVKKALDLAEPLVQAFNEINARVVPGGGGYVYAQYPDGSIIIKEGPGGLRNVKVKNGSKAWKAITNEIGPWISPTAEEVDYYQQLEFAFEDFERALDHMHDAGSTGQHDELVDRAIALYDEYPEMVRRLGESNGFPDDVVTRYIADLKTTRTTMLEVDFADERALWEANSAERADLLGRIQAFPEASQLEDRFSAIVEKADLHYLYADANADWDDFWPECDAKLRDFEAGLFDPPYYDNEGAPDGDWPDEYGSVEDDPAESYDALIADTFEAISDDETRASAQEDLHNAFTTVESVVGQDLYNHVLKRYGNGNLEFDPDIAQDEDDFDLAKTSGGSTALSWKALVNNQKADADGSTKGLYLAGVLVHEYNHTRQAGTPRPVDEGRAYAVEQWFLKQAGGLEAREDEIHFYITNPSNGDMDNQGRAAFLATRALTGLLQDRVDAGDSPETHSGYPGWPKSIRNLTAKKAKQLLLEFLGAGERGDKWSSELEEVARDVEKNIRNIPHNRFTEWDSPVTPYDVKGYLEDHEGEELIP